MQKYEICDYGSLKSLDYNLPISKNAALIILYGVL